MSVAEPICPSCTSSQVRHFYSVDSVPTNSVLQLHSRQEALAVLRGEIALGHCTDCGHVHNIAFLPELTEYSGRYESTQGYSATFNAFHRRLADDTIRRFGVRGKEITEIGCGNGEFLVPLCEQGGNRGIGFDPAFQPGRVPVAAGTEVEFVADFYPAAGIDRLADLIVCKMTLEHIVDTARFVRRVRESIGDHRDTVVTFQVPNARYVFGDRAFWDIYYEHCSYFTHGSLARVFRAERFDVFDLWTDYDDQYLMIAARPAPRPTAPVLEVEDDRGAVAAELDAFAIEVPRRLAAWRDRLRAHREAGRRVVLWGGGSKGVAFLTTLGLDDEIAAVVDINPNKAGKFMAGTGHQIVSPHQLAEIRPDVVVVMNPIYTEEVRGELDSLGVQSDVVPAE